MTSNEFIEECSKINIIIDNDKLAKLNKYMDLLIEWNNKFNLTSIIDKNDIYLKHFYDSLCLNMVLNLKENLSVCDFGTGAGFPGMVLAIIFPKIDVTLIESSNKKVMFLNEVKKSLIINNVKIVNSRVEEYAKNNRNSFDTVTCRAVSNLGIICELSIALLKLGGLFTPLKSNIDEDLKKYTHEIVKLGYNHIQTINYELPIEHSKRSIPVFQKISKTDIKYPRNYNVILKTYK